MNQNINFYLKSAIIGGLFAIPFIPLIISPSLFFPFISGKGFVFRALVEIIFALWLILALRDSDYRPKVSHLLSFTTLFIGIVFLADIFGVAPYKSLWSNFERMEGFVALFHHFLYFLVLGSVLVSERFWSLFFHTSIGVSFFIGLYSLLQLGGELMINQGGVRVDATFGNAAYLAAYLLIHIFLILFYVARKRLENVGDVLLSVALGSLAFLGYYGLHVMREGVESVGNVGGILLVIAAVLFVASFSIYATSRRSIWYSRFGEPSVYILLLLLNGIVLIFTATRGAILGLFGGIIVSSILVVWLERERVLFRRIGAGVLIGVVVIAGIFFALRETSFIKSSPTLSRLSSISLSEGTPRFTIWNIGWQGFLERPILGYGQENFNYLFNTYYHPRMYAQEQWFDRAHNVFFDWLTAAGALGLLSYVSLYGAALWLIWKREDRVGWFSRLMKKLHLSSDNNFSVTERAILTGLLGAYFFQNIFVFDNIVTYILFFSLLAYIHQTHSSALSDTWQKRLSFESGFVNRILTPIIIVCLSISLFVVVFRPLYAGSMLLNALRDQSNGNIEGALAKYQNIFSMGTFANSESREQLVQFAINVANNPEVDVTTKQTVFALAKTELEKQIKSTPEDARYALFMGYLYNRSRQSVEAIPFLEKAVALSPQKQTMYFELGSAFLSAGKYEDAYNAFKTAYELEPAYKEAAAFYVIGLIYTNRIQEAQTVLSSVYGTTVVDDDRIIKAYFDTRQWTLLFPILEARVEVQPLNEQYRINLAAAYLESGERQKAIEQLSALLEFPNMDEQSITMVNRWISEIRAGRNPQ